LQRATDYHQLNVTSITGMGAPTVGYHEARTVSEFFHTLADRTVMLPSSLGTPTITDLTTDYVRLQASYPIGTEYNGGASFHYNTLTAPIRSVVIGATSGWIGGTTVTLGMPDFHD
jgi:hypothetical protein